MCERRATKMRKGLQLIRLRQTRRMQRRRRTVAQPVEVVAEPTPTPCPNPVVDKQAQCRLILELTIKTITLMQKSSLIQKQILALRKETFDFVSTVMNNPENKKRYLEHLRLHGGAVHTIQGKTQAQPKNNLSSNKLSLTNLPLNNLSNSLPLSDLGFNNLSLNNLPFSNLPLKNLHCNSQPLNNLPFNSLPMELEPVAQ